MARAQRSKNLMYWKYKAKEKKEREGEEGGDKGREVLAKTTETPAS